MIKDSGWVEAIVPVGCPFCGKEHSEMVLVKKGSTVDPITYACSGCKREGGKIRWLVQTMCPLCGFGSTKAIYAEKPPIKSDSVIGLICRQCGKGVKN